MFALFKSVKGLSPTVAVLIALAVGFSSGAMFLRKKPQVQYVDVPVEVINTVTDTVYVYEEVPVTKYITKAITDTVWLEEDEPAAFELLSSTTVDLNTEDADYGSIDIEYIHDPWDAFHTTFYPAPLPTITKTVTQVQYRPTPLKYYQKPWFNWVVGVGMGAIATKWYSDHANN